MTIQEKWNLIVDDYHKLLHEQEAKVQAFWETYCSELLGYKKVLGEIEAQRSIHIGSSDRVIPDIILCKDGKDIFDIELKKYSLPFDDSFEKQPISYMNMVHLSVGMIVCKSIYLYTYDYAGKDLTKIKIAFKKDDPDGIKLLELLDHDAFSKDSIWEFVKQRKARDRNVKEIEALVTPDYIRELVNADLKKKYSAEEIEQGLRKKTFSVLSANTQNTRPSTPPDDTPSTVFSQDLAGKYEKIIRKWCEQKAEAGRIQFNPQFSNKAYIRFSTATMDAFIPPQASVISGWGNHNFYSYQITNKGNKIWLGLALSNKNTPATVWTAFNTLFSVCASYPPKEDWEWRTMWAEKPVSYELLPDDAAVFSLLDQQFESVMTRETQFFAMLHC